MTLHEMFEAQAERTPDQVAVVLDQQKLTYGELNRRSNQLAHHLRGLGVGPEVLVGLFVERSLEMIVGLLGILKAGGAYVPIDPNYPKERVMFMLEDARAPVLLTQSKLAANLPVQQAQVVRLDEGELSGYQGQPTSNPLTGATADNLAYVIYTSGTTGLPKGTLITHRNVTRLFRSNEPWFGFNERDVWTLFHSCAFDFSVWEIWGALLYGGRLVVVPFMTSRAPEEFYQLLVREQVTVLNQTPSAFRQLVQAEESVGQKDLALRYVIFGGEALEMGSLRPWFERHGDEKPRLVNMYGITETSVHVTYRPLSKADVSSGSVIGVPIPDLQVYILDSQAQPVPIGVRGEMYVGGAGLARGYLNRPELTAERFIPDHLTGRPGSRLYRTGDLARFLPGRDIEYLGRTDQQVKIRGFRIELGEIESALVTHPAVSAAAVVVREESPGEKRLVAYIVPREVGNPLAAKGLRSFLKDKLPEYMVPADFITLSALPLTPSGKVDRKALPVRSVAPQAVARYVPPRDLVERQLVRIWEEIFDVRPIGIEDDFFDLGGHSLLAVRMMSRIEDAYGVRLPLAALFTGTTIKHLAECLNAESLSAVNSPIVPVQAGGSHPPLFFLHGGGGLYCRNLARLLGPDQPFYAVVPVDIDDDPSLTTVEAMAEATIKRLIASHPRGPYLIGGYCHGGVIAYEIARQLEQLGSEVGPVILLDALVPRYFGWLKALIRSAGWLLRLKADTQTRLFVRLRKFVMRASTAHREGIWKFLTLCARTAKTDILRLAGTPPEELGIPGPPLDDPDGPLADLQYRGILMNYRPKSFAGHVLLMRTHLAHVFYPTDRTSGWGKLAGQVEVHELPGDHATCQTEHIGVVAEHIARRLREYYAAAEQDMARTG